MKQIIAAFILITLCTCSPTNNDTAKNKKIMFIYKNNFFTYNLSGIDWAIATNKNQLIIFDKNSGDTCKMEWRTNEQNYIALLNTTKEANIRHINNATIMPIGGKTLCQNYEIYHKKNGLEARYPEGRCFPNGSGNLAKGMMVFYLTNNNRFGIVNIKKTKKHPKTNHRILVRYFFLEKERFMVITCRSASNDFYAIEERLYKKFIQPLKFKPESGRKKNK